MTNELTKFFCDKRIGAELSESLQHITTSFFNRGKSSLQFIINDLREMHGVNITDLQLLEYIRTLEELDLIKVDTTNSLYHLTEKGYNLY